MKAPTGRTPGQAGARRQRGEGESQHGHDSPRFRFRSWMGGLCLAVMTIAAYQPVWRAGFVWDDDVYVTQNQLLTAPDGLKRIWFSEDSPSQYFPLVYTTFRLERALWELNPAGYHWVNLLLHAANALLVWRVLKRLRVPGAWLAAAFFALHPVQVESVAWVTERKNVLSLFFYLLSLQAWVGFVEATDNSGARHGWLRYALALGAYLLALFSKTTACTLPAALLLVLWLRRKTIDGRRWLQVAPFVGLGLGMGLLTMWWERHHMGTGGGIFALGPLERILIAGRAVWFYLGKLLWPANLTFSYPRWQINPADPTAYGWLLLCALIAGVLYFGRRRAGRGPEVAALFYVFTLSPMLGLVMLYTFRYTFVADHYQYVAAIGPLALAAAAIARVLTPKENVAAGSSNESGTLPVMSVGAWVGGALCAGLVLALAVLTWRQASAYQSVETLWRDTLAKNSGSWMAHGNLGRTLMHQGRYDEAMREYEAALAINPRDVDSLVSVGNALFGKRQFEAAAGYYQKALEVNPDNPEAHINLAVILANGGKVDEAIAHGRKALEINPRHITARVNLAVALGRKGQYEEALQHYRTALELNPGLPSTHLNMAIALKAMGRTEEAQEHYRLAARAANEHAAALAQQGRLAEAVAQYREAIRLIPDNAEAHCGLGALLARAGRREEAREHFEEALRLKPDYPEAQRQLRALAPVEGRK